MVRRFQGGHSPHWPLSARSSRIGLHCIIGRPRPASTPLQSVINHSLEIYTLLHFSLQPMRIRVSGEGSHWQMCLWQVEMICDNTYSTLFTLYKCRQSCDNGAHHARLLAIVQLEAQQSQRGGADNKCFSRRSRGLPFKKQIASIDRGARAAFDCCQTELWAASYNNAVFVLLLHICDF